MAALYRQSDGSVFVFDSVLAVVHRPRVQVTEHPIEDGASISDHIQERPLELAIDVLVTGTPLDPAENATSGNERLQDARQWLDKSVGEALTFSSDRFGDYADLALVTYSHEERNLEEVRFGLNLQQVQVALASSIAVPESIASTSGLASETQQGASATSEEEQASEAAAEAERSTLANILGV